MLQLEAIIMHEVTYISVLSLRDGSCTMEQVCFKVEKKEKQNMFAADAGTSHLLPHVQGNN
jgi:hypothetical protein